MRRWVGLLVVLVMDAGVAQAQLGAVELGVPFHSEHYPAQVYGQHPQNWDVVQDHRGFTYVANDNGILEYDGVHWRTIRPLTNTFVRALATDTNGRVYVGQQNDLGYLAPDSVGRTRFVSLLGEVARRDRAFKDIWSADAVADTVFFMARKRLFRWDGAEMTAWASERGFHTSFAVRERFYVNEAGRGLHRVVGDALRRVPGGARFDDIGIWAMVPYGQGRTLIGTRLGFFVMGEGGIERIETEADPFLESGRLYHGVGLPGGHVALSLMGGGVVVMDQEGRLVQVLSQAAELQDDSINHLFADTRGTLWMALDNSGVARADVTSPLTMYDERTGLSGRIQHIHRHAGTLYVATGSGLYYLQQVPVAAAARAAERRTSFRPVPRMLHPWDLLSAGGDLLAAADEGIYRIDGARSEQLSKQKAFSLVASTRFPGRIYVGLKDGLGVLQREVQGWTVKKIEGISEEIRSTYEEEEGTLWLGTVNGEVLRARFPGRADARPEVTRFDTSDGLPGEQVHLSSIAGEPVVAAQEDIYRIYVKHGRTAFRRDTTLLPEDPAADGPLLSMVTVPRGDVWMVFEDRVSIARRQPDRSFEIEAPPALRFPKASPSQIYVEENGIVWIGSGNELLRYDAGAPPLHEGDFNVYVRHVAVTGSDDVFFGGAQPAGDDSAFSAEVPYAQSSLRITYAAPMYNTVTPVEYQYKMEGVDAQWSDWTTATSKTYAALWEGAYRFHVRARNERGQEAAVASFSVVVLPPWYRTPWAYLAYVLLAALLVAAALHYRRIYVENKRARAQAAEMERQRVNNERLREVSEQLEAANQMKETFLSSISHELRTPLTAITGFAAVIREESENPYHHEFLDLIEKNGHRLMDTLNALLDIAKLRAGVVNEHRENVNVGRAAQTALRSVQSKAKEKGLDLELVRPRASIYAYANCTYLERILHNVVGNAIKFTKEGGVTVQVQQAGWQAEVRVRDTGIGMEADFIPHVFEEFKQESTGEARAYEGSGLGLAVTARMVEAMEGRIEVESAKDEGSTFVITLPGPRQEKDHEPSEGEPGGDREDGGPLSDDGSAGGSVSSKEKPPRFKASESRSSAAASHRRRGRGALRRFR